MLVDWTALKKLPSLPPTPTHCLPPLSVLCCSLLCFLESSQFADPKQDVQTDLAWKSLLTVSHLNCLAPLPHFRVVVLSCAVNSSLLSLFSSGHGKQHTDCCTHRNEFSSEILPVLIYSASWSSQIRTWNAHSLVLPERTEGKCNSCAAPIKFKISCTQFSASRFSVPEHNPYH